MVLSVHGFAGNDDTVLLLATRHVVPLPLIALSRLGSFLGGRGPVGAACRLPVDHPSCTGGIPLVGGPCQTRAAGTASRVDARVDHPLFLSVDEALVARFHWPAGLAASRRSCRLRWSGRPWPQLQNCVEVVLCADPFHCDVTSGWNQVIGHEPVRFGFHNPADRFGVDEVGHMMRVATPKVLPMAGGTSSVTLTRAATTVDSMCSTARRKPGTPNVKRGVCRHPACSRR